MYFTYRGRDSKEFGMKIISSNHLSFSARNIETVEVDGKTGDLLIDHGNYKNFIYKVEVDISSDNGDLETICSNIKNWLRSGYEYSELKLYRNNKLIKTYEATFINSLDIVEVYKNCGTCLLMFSCKGA